MARREGGRQRGHGMVRSTAHIMPKQPTAHGPTVCRLQELSRYARQQPELHSAFCVLPRRLDECALMQSALALYSTAAAARIERAQKEYDSTWTAHALLSGHSGQSREQRAWTWTQKPLLN